MPDWKPLELEDRDAVTQRLRRHPPRISEHTFTNLWVWGERRAVSWAMVGDSLVFRQQQDGECSVLGPPRGPDSAADLLGELAADGLHCFERIPTETADALREQGLTVQEDRDNADYVYRRRDLVELPGREYHRQKNLVNQCLSSYECSYCAVTADLTGELWDMQERWCEERNCDKREGLCAERLAIRRALDHFAELELTGGVVRIQGAVQAYALGERLSPDTAAVHFEKAMTRFNGLYQVINRWFAEHGLEEFEFINREQDLGIPGLRKAKESYHPHHMVDKHTAALEAEALAQAAPAARGRCGEG
ncbi:MAG: phosphatidylglycerol lysyltransferase domain-containing protein [Candidatus Brocadiia bacterium]